jgi:pimeloyl-ACP methyl ester carboxylesterase
VLSIFIIVLLVITNASLRKSDKDVYTYFDEQNISEAQIERFNFQDKEIRYVSSGLQATDSTTAVLFIHGAPGSSDSFYGFLADSLLRQQFHLITIDRLGYGYSDYGNAETDIQKQAEPLKELINHIPAKDWIIVSHSYGCAVSGMLAIQQAKKIKANLMLCPVIHPKHEKVFFFSSWPIKPILSKAFSKAYKVSSHEKMTHAYELKNIEGSWSETTVPTIVMHGKKDWIAPVENADYLKNFISDDLLTVRIYSEFSHFIPWTQADLVSKELITLAAQ